MCGCARVHQVRWKDTPKDRLQLTQLPSAPLGVFQPLPESSVCLIDISTQSSTENRISYLDSYADQQHDFLIAGIER